MTPTQLERASALIARKREIEVAKQDDRARFEFGVKHLDRLFRFALHWLNPDARGFNNGKNTWPTCTVGELEILEVCDPGNVERRFGRNFAISVMEAKEHAQKLLPFLDRAARDTYFIEALKHEGTA